MCNCIKCMSKVIKILLKNVIVVSFSVVIVMTAILSALITRHFDSKECDSKVQIYEARLKKEINSRLRDENVNFDKMMPVQKNDSKDIVVSVEIMKSESKQSINNGDNKQRNKKTAQKYDNKKKQKKTPINNKKTETKEKKYDGKNSEELAKDDDGSNVINIINNNVILKSDDESDINDVVKETLTNWNYNVDNVLFINGDSKTNVKENLVDLQINEQTEDSKKNDFVPSKPKDKELKKDGEVANESTIIVNDVKNLDAKKEKNNSVINDRLEFKKESDEIHNTIVLIDE